VGKKIVINDPLRPRERRSTEPDLGGLGARLLAISRELRGPPFRVAGDDQGLFAARQREAAERSELNAAFERLAAALREQNELLKWIERRLCERSGGPRAA
jgi:hypothetical protein